MGVVVKNFTPAQTVAHDVIGRAHDIGERLRCALRLVDSIAITEGSSPRRSIVEGFVTTVLALRRMREHHFDPTLFAEPAWDMLLELYAAHIGQRRISIKSLCIGAAVPTTTALRWFRALETRGLIERTPDNFDRRRVFVSLSPQGVRAMDEFFAAAQERMMLT